MIGAESAISLRSARSSAKRINHDPARLHAGHHAVAERRMHDVIAEPEGGRRRLPDARAAPPVASRPREPHDVRPRASPAEPPSARLVAVGQLGRDLVDEAAAQRRSSRAPNTARVRA